jgi:hypothetical protein
VPEAQSFLKKGIAGRVLFNILFSHTFR